MGDLPEIVEEEIDGEPVPVNVTLPLTINGRIFPREDVDLWVSSEKVRLYSGSLVSETGIPTDSHRSVAGKTIAEYRSF